MLKIDIVSDIVCPWCFIGLRRLETAVAMVRSSHPGFVHETHWRPFFLNPNTPPEGEPYLPFLIRKFGSLDAVEALFERVRDAGREYGIEYAFEKIALRANTFQGHRLLYWAQQHGNADKLVKRLFVAQFQRGEHVGDRQLLIRLAVECGYDEASVSRLMNSDDDAAAVRDDARQIREMGIRMVPTFILNNDQVIVGAEDPRLLADALRRSIPQKDQQPI